MGLNFWISNRSKLKKKNRTMIFHPSCSNLTFRPCASLIRAPCASLIRAPCASLIRAPCASLIRATLAFADSGAPASCVGLLRFEPRFLYNTKWVNLTDNIDFM
jgi:hypothetical protein